jgi:hypothetical protein
LSLTGWFWSEQLEARFPHRALTQIFYTPRQVLNSLSKRNGQKPPAALFHFSFKVLNRPWVGTDRRAVRTNRRATGPAVPPYRRTGHSTHFVPLNVIGYEKQQFRERILRVNYAGLTVAILFNVCRRKSHAKVAEAAKDNLHKRLCNE